MSKNKKTSNSIRISVISIVINVALSLVKFIAGEIGHSQALIADAVHSLSDVLTTFVVIAALLVSAKGPDKEHPYGHQRYESLASLFLALLLGYVGIKIGVSGFRSVLSGAYKAAPVATVLTAAAAAVSILTKEIMYQKTIRVARRERNNALKADAWHHRSDALSSVGSLLGIIMAKLGLPIMDPIAGLVICVFILLTAGKILWDAVKALTDSSGGPELERGIRETVSAVEGVQKIDLLRTRIFGSGFYADIEIEVDGADTLEEAHLIAEKVHDQVEAGFPDVWHCMVHVNPSEK